MSKSKISRKKRAAENDPYLQSKKQDLDHFFGHTVALARLSHLSGDTSDTPELQRKFVAGLRRSLKSRLSDHGGVTATHLREMITLARSKPWRDVEVIKALYRRYHEITGKPHDEKKLFPKK